MGMPQLFDEDDQNTNASPEDKALEVPTDDVVDEEVSSLEDIEQEAQPSAEQPQQVDDIPEKYRGKSPAELVRMHQEAEQALGRQGGEVGELRKVVDEYIRSQTVAPTQPQAAQDDDQDDDIDFYTDPSAAVRKAIESHPAIQSANQVNNEFRKGTALANLQQKHPDMTQIVQDPKFAEWVQSKKGLTEMFVKADQEYDFDSADTLFTLWKDRASVAQQTVNVEKQARKQQAKAASTGNTQGQPPGAARKKIYRRADIINLINTDPDRYNDMQEDIMAAYAEGRVK